MNIVTVVLKPRKDLLLAVILMLFVVWNCLLQLRVYQLQNESSQIASELQHLVLKTSPRLIPVHNPKS